MIKLLIVCIIASNFVLTKDLLVGSSDPVKLILEMIAGTSAEVISLRKGEFDTKNYDPNSDQIILAGSSDAFFYTSNDFENWTLDIPARSKIKLASLLSEEEKIFISDSNMASFWWLDPKILANMLPKIADSMSVLIPENANSFQANTKNAVSKLQVLDGYISGILKKDVISTIFEEFPILLYFAESYNLPYSDFLYYEFGDRMNSFNSGITESLNVSKTKEFLTHTSKPDSVLKEISLKLKFQILSIDIFPREKEDYYAMMERIAHQFKQIYSN